jgi:hypothetical protein
LHFLSLLSFAHPKESNKEKGVLGFPRPTMGSIPEKAEPFVTQIEVEYLGLPQKSTAFIRDSMCIGLNRVQRLVWG